MEVDGFFEGIWFSEGYEVWDRFLIVYRSEREDWKKKRLLYEVSEIVMA